MNDRSHVAEIEVTTRLEYLRSRDFVFGWSRYFPPLTLAELLQTDYWTLRLTIPELVTWWVGAGVGDTGALLFPPQAVTTPTSTRDKVSNNAEKNFRLAFLFLKAASGNKKSGNNTDAYAAPGTVSLKTTVT